MKDLKSEYSNTLDGIATVNAAIWDLVFCR